MKKLISLISFLLLFNLFSKSVLANSINELSNNFDVRDYPFLFGLFISVVNSEGFYVYGSPRLTAHQYDSFYIPDDTFKFSSLEEADNFVRSQPLEYWNTCFPRYQVAFFSFNSADGFYKKIWNFTYSSSRQRFEVQEVSETFFGILDFPLILNTNTYNYDGYIAPQNMEYSNIDFINYINNYFRNRIRTASFFGDFPTYPSDHYDYFKDYFNVLFPIPNWNNFGGGHFPWVTVFLNGNCSPLPPCPTKYRFNIIHKWMKNTKHNYTTNIKCYSEGKNEEN